MMILSMSHELAKQVLEQADTLPERTEAVRQALEQGMPLHEIERYLDWLDMRRTQSGDQVPPAACDIAERQASDDEVELRRSSSA